MLEDKIGVGQCEIVISCVFTCGWGDGSQMGEAPSVVGVAIAHTREVAERM